MKRIFTLLAFIFFGLNMINSQSIGNISITISKNSDVLATENTSNQKQVEFTVSGLSSPEEAQIFSEKIKSYRGVINFELSDADAGNTRIATAVFYHYANKKYYCALMNYCGVYSINFNNKIYTVNEFKNIKAPNK